jgi:hypothetical protein
MDITYLVVAAIERFKQKLLEQRITMIANTITIYILMLSMKDRFMHFDHLLMISLALSMEAGGGTYDFHYHGY